MTPIKDLHINYPDGEDDFPKLLPPQLQEGEQLCPKCKGFSWWWEETAVPDMKHQVCCDRCKGYGKLDWIEMIVGKRDRTLMRMTFTPDGRVGIGTVCPSQALHII